MGAKRNTVHARGTAYRRDLNGMPNGASTPVAPVEVPANDLPRRVGLATNDREAQRAHPQGDWVDR
jgi:hypothetical protein